MQGVRLRYIHVLTARIYISCGGQSTATLIIINHNFVLFYFVSQPVQFGEHFIPSREKIITVASILMILNEFAKSR